MPINGQMPIQNFMRKIKINDAKLTKILKERGAVLTEARKLQKEKELIEKEQAKLGYKMNRLKEKTQPIIEKLTPSFELGEFEIIGSVGINKENFTEVEILDQIEEYKKFLKEEKK